MTSDFLYLSFSTLYFISLWITNTIIFAKLNTSPLSNKPPVSTVKKITPLGGFIRHTHKLSLSCLAVVLDYFRV